MRFALVGDLHSHGTQLPDAQPPGDFVELLLQRTVRHLNRFHKPDLLVVAGDLLDDGMAADAPARRRQLREILQKAEMPTIVLPGNHDGDRQAFYADFERPPAWCDSAGVRVLPLLDEDMPNYNAQRPAANLDVMRQARQSWDGPIVTVQHVPLSPPESGASVYNYLNAAEVIRVMREERIALAAAAHDHAGFELLDRSAPGPAFLCTPALCVFPFSFLMVTVDADGTVTSARQRLALEPEHDLMDIHVHSQFAYCGDRMDIAGALRMGRSMGAGALGFTEHSGQLYFTAERFWGGHFKEQGCDFDQGVQPRSDAYFAALEAAGVPQVARGLEADCAFDGRPVLFDRDRDRAGYLLGATHWLRATRPPNEGDATRAEAELLATWEHFLPTGIGALAHPFRVLKDAPSDSVQDALVRLLHQHGVAAEMNFHHGAPPVAFVERCLNAGVRLALGSDSHHLSQVADLVPHLAMLRTLGVGPTDYPRVLWDPRRHAT